MKMSRMTWAVVAALASGCGVGADDTLLASDTAAIDAADQAVSLEIGRELNGRELNGRELNGRELNGRELKGPDLVDLVADIRRIETELKL